MSVTSLNGKLEDSQIERPLPVTMDEYNAFLDRVIALAGSYADRDSMEFAISSILIHAPPEKGSLSDDYFISRLRKSAANQFASQKFQDIKAKQAEAQKAADAAQQLKGEATADTGVVSEEKN